jgi:hypothetical protein
MIESVLTHKPDSKDPTDSLVRQVSAKMNLVRNRFERDIDPGSYFVKHKGSLGDFTKMWKNLYDIRSTIIHGGNLSFESRTKSGNFESVEAVNKYLHDNVRELIKLYFEEPVLLRDLKDC